MKYNGDAKIIKAKIPDPEPENKGSDLFTDEPVKTPWEKEAEKNAPAPDENAVDYEPAPETDMDFMTEEEEKEHRKSVIIGAIIGLLIAGLLIGGYIYHNQTGKIRGANVSTTVTTEKASQKYGSLEPTQNTTRTYKTQQLTVHKDENGVWRSYAGLDKTVGYTGVVGNDTGWWYVENDVINFKYNGIASNDYGQWLVENGKVNTKFSGNYVYNGRMYHIQDGMVIGNEPLTNKATTSTTAKATTTTTVTISAVPVTAATVCDHHWIPIYEGDAIVQTGIRGNSVCRCPDCGLLFDNAALLESHIYTTEGHQKIKLVGHSIDSDLYVVEKKDIANSDTVDVVIGYTKDPTRFVCSECGKETTDADEANFF